MFVLRDVRLAARQLFRQPVFTVTAVVTLGIGIGLNAVAFTVVNGLLFKRHGVAARADVGRIATTPGGDESGSASLAEYERFAEATSGSLDLAAEGRASVAWRHDGVTETAWVLFVSPAYFSMVEAQPLAGTVSVGRANGVPAVVVGERFWRQKLNAAPLAGLTLSLNGVEAGVAGVLPASFRGPAGLYSPDVWLPLDDRALFRTSSALQKPDSRWLFVMGRLRPGVGVAEVRARLDTAAAQMAHDWPDTHRHRGARFRLFKEGNSELRALTTVAAVAMGIMGLVLLLACFNVANLLLARAVEREREMGIRAAIGAGALRLIGLVVAEGFVLALLAGAAALLVSWWTQTLVSSFAIPIEEPQYIDLSPDWTVAGFIAALVLVAGVLPGLWPALTAARVDVVRVLGSHGASSIGGRPSPMRRWLVGAQIAGSTAFLAIALLFAQSYGKLSIADLGFDRDRLLAAEFEPASHGYDADRSERYVESLATRVRALPGVVDVAVADRAPFFIGFDRLTAVASPSAPCAPETSAKHATVTVGPGYFRTMGIPLAAGREFQVSDRAHAIVNQPLARAYWPDGSGVGKILRVGARGTPVTVIGITSTTRTRGLNREQPTLYLPLAHEDFEGALSLVVRTAMPPERLVRPFVESAQAIDPRVAMSSVKTMEQRVAVQLWPFRTISWLFSICGVLALVLATAGLAGVVIHAVNRRLKEFGVRLSVGATRRHLVVDVLRGTARLLLPGVLAGTLLAAVSARVIQAAFVGVNVLNPATYVAVALFECTIVAIACVGPAIRASRVDPLIALRSS